MFSGKPYDCTVNNSQLSLKIDSHFKNWRVLTTHSCAENNFAKHLLHFKGGLTQIYNAVHLQFTQTYSDTARPDPLEDTAVQ